MIWVVIIMATGLAISWFTIYALATRRVITSGTPTADEAKISDKMKIDAGSLAEDAAVKIEEIKHAPDSMLLESLRDELRKK